MIGRNDICFCGSGKKWKKCHYPNTPLVDEESFLRASYAKKYNILIKTEEEIEGIRRSGHLAASILHELCEKAVEGVTTDELNTLAVKLHKEAKAIAAPLGYGSPPFPKSICTSFNDVICHGIPGPERLKKGDILNIDVTCILDGFYGDCSKMVAIGEISEEKRRVMEASYEALMEAIKCLRPSVLVEKIGEVIENVAERYNCSVVRQFVGHGVGLKFHEAPQIPHFKNNLKIPLVPGMIFTIEPMINAGVFEAVIDPQDKWTARTKDGRPSAQWEHTLLITKEGCEILTPWKR
jgi:methionyl aminopeptidase